MPGMIYSDLAGEITKVVSLSREFLRLNPGKLDEKLARKYVVCAMLYRGEILREKVINDLIAEIQLKILNAPEGEQINAMIDVFIDRYPDCYVFQSGM